MAEVQKIGFDHNQVTEALVKQAGIHEGIWALYMEFGIAAANVASGPSDTYNPAAIIPVVKIGLERTDKQSNLSVDAAKVNPLVRIKNPNTQKKR